jgi:hypothetical protein
MVGLFRQQSMSQNKFNDIWIDSKTRSSDPIVNCQRLITLFRKSGELIELECFTTQLYAR